MERQVIKTDGAPNPTGPFNQAIRVGNLVFTSGQAGRNRETGKMGDVREQTDWSLRNLDNILRAAGSSLDDAVKVTVIMKDGVDSNAMNEEYVKHFSGPLPARSSAFVSRLKGDDMLLEIEVVAVVRES
ncbi:MAG TPA: Rid family detoxifying hydrolase [Chloroflexota bacterium]|nr:Rid family detoxifying hydrolase [Chloroflexota bacterium]